MCEQCVRDSKMLQNGAQIGYFDALFDLFENKSRRRLKQQLTTAIARTYRHVGGLRSIVNLTTTVLGRKGIHPGQRLGMVPEFRDGFFHKWSEEERVCHMHAAAFVQAISVADLDAAHAAVEAIENLRPANSGSLIIDTLIDINAGRVEVSYG